MNIVYTAAHQTADDYILEMLDYAQNPHNEMVISSDNDLLRRSKQKGARTKTIEEFLTTISKKKPTPTDKKPSNESPAELARLLKIFEKPSQ
jgi:predicted RNA-binding protein with PIN domain